jgi:MFS family permease
MNSNYNIEKKSANRIVKRQISILIFPSSPWIMLAVAQGIFSSMLSAGAVIDLVIGASVIESFGWRATFLLIIPITITLFVYSLEAM